MKVIVVGVSCGDVETLYTLRFDESQFPVGFVRDHVVDDVSRSISDCLESVAVRVRYRKELDAALASQRAAKTRSGI